MYICMDWHAHIYVCPLWNYRFRVLDLLLGVLVSVFSRQIFTWRKRISLWKLIKRSLYIKRILGLNENWYCKIKHKQNVGKFWQDFFFFNSSQSKRVATYVLASFSPPLHKGKNIYSNKEIDINIHHIFTAPCNMQICIFFHVNQN